MVGVKKGEQTRKQPETIHQVRGTAWSRKEKGLSPGPQQWPGNLGMDVSVSRNRPPTGVPAAGAVLGREHSASDAADRASGKLSTVGSKDAPSPPSDPSATPSSHDLGECPDLWPQFPNL